MTKKLNYAIVGCGKVGEKRSKSLSQGQLMVACDINLSLAEKLIVNSNGKATKNFKQAVTDPGVDIVIISTINSALSRIAEAAIKAGKHVLIEKPVGINSKEIENLIKLAKKNKVLVRAGFNHRYHPSILKAQEITASDEFGSLMFVRGRYGHGGRVGYDQEWRANPKLSGGGELIDQGVHLIDLARLFLGDFKHIDGYAATYFWNMKVDDNSFLNLRTKKGQTAWLHVSCTEWKNLFSLEIYGRYGKLHIEGLGGSYGLERLHYYKMLPEMGPPITKVFEFPESDDSWAKEIQTFEEDIRFHKNPDPSLKDALAVMDIVEKVYKKSGY